MPELTPYTGDLSGLSDEELLSLLPDDEAMPKPGADNALGMASFVDTTPEPVDPVNPEIVVPAFVASLIRTITPMVVGWVIAGLTGVGLLVGGWLGVSLGLPADLAAWLETSVPLILGSCYYFLARKLEQRWPSIPWLGSRRQPVYTDPAVPVDGVSLAGPAAFLSLVSTGQVLIHSRRGCTCQRDTLPKIEAELRALGVIIQDLAGLITQQAYNSTVSASKSTHGGGGVWDVPARLVDTDEKRAVWLKWGWVPFYRVTADAPVSKWAPHGHLVVIGCTHRALSAVAQEESFRRGRNGLANNGPFRGKLPAVIRTWAQALVANAPKPVTPKPVVKPAAPKPVVSPLRDLKRGVSGNDVKKLQSELLRVFPSYAKRIRWSGGPNTKFGPATEAVVKEFQRRARLKVDGIVGSVTRAALKRNGVRL
jgi:peptidoglycan hydrolase-like protein with peptidoglycan-binding domain